MDLTRHAMLNDLGLVQHAVLESPDQNTVHVIYGRDNRYFVLTELTTELEARTGLKLVPPQSPVATSSSEGESVVIVIVGRHDSPFIELRSSDCDDSLTDGLLREAAETAAHPDTYTLFLQKGGHRPDWVDSKLPRSTLMFFHSVLGEFW